MKRHALLPILLTLFIASCSEETTTLSNIEAPSTTSTVDNTQIQSNFDDINRIVQIAFENAKIGESNTKDTTNFDCYEINVDTTNKTAQIIFDSTQICLDGKRRSGTLDIDYTGPYRTTGSVITTTLNNYVVNDVKLEGTKVLTNKGLNNENNIEYGIEITEAKRTAVNGDIITWESSRTREWIEGAETILNFTDDVYLIYGSASGNNSENKDFDVVITDSNPLKLDIACWLTNRIPVSGEVTITPKGEEKRIIDYGNGECDKNLTIKYLENSFEVTAGVN